MAQFPTLRLEQGRRFGYGHLFAGGADFENYVLARIRRGNHLDVLLDKLLESGGGHGNLVSARRNGLDEVSRGGRAAAINNAGLVVPNFDLSRRNNRARGIGNGPGNGALVRLRKQSGG